MPRLTSLNDIKAHKIVTALRGGASRRAAAESAGISTVTLTYWLRKGREGQEPYVALLTRVLEAEANAETVVVGHLMSAIEKGSVPAMTFWLERRRTSEWGKTTDQAKAEQDAAEDEDRQGSTDLEVAKSVVAALESQLSKVG